MVAPVAMSRDEALNITWCSRRMVIELPPGTEAVFGAQRLEADVEYAAQEAADGSGLVYRLQGAEPITSRIASSPIERLGSRAPIETAAVGRPPPIVPVTDQPPQSVDDPGARAEPERPRIGSGRPEPQPEAERSVEAPRRSTPPVAAPVRTAARPSFNCRYARSRSEKLVCADTDLARDDRGMSSEFYAALARGDGRMKAALRNSRDRFLRFRDRCPDAACIAQSYAGRIDEIRDIEAGQ